MKTQEEWIRAKETGKVSVSEDGVLDFLRSTGMACSTREITEHLFGKDASQSQIELVLNKLKQMLRDGKIDGDRQGMTYQWILLSS